DHQGVRGRPRARHGEDAGRRVALGRLRHGRLDRDDRADVDGHGGVGGLATGLHGVGERVGADEAGVGGVGDSLVAVDADGTVGRARVADDVQGVAVGVVVVVQYADGGGELLVLRQGVTVVVRFGGLVGDVDVDRGGVVVDAGAGVVGERVVADEAGVGGVGE